MGVGFLKLIEFGIILKWKKILMKLELFVRTFSVLLYEKKKKNPKETHSWSYTTVSLNPK